MRCWEMVRARGRSDNCVCILEITGMLQKFVPTRLIASNSLPCPFPNVVPSPKAGQARGLSFSPTRASARPHPPDVPTPCPYASGPTSSVPVWIFGESVSLHARSPKTGQARGSFPGPSPRLAPTAAVEHRRFPFGFLGNRYRAYQEPDGPEGGGTDHHEQNW